MTMLERGKSVRQSRSLFEGKYGSRRSIVSCGELVAGHIVGSALLLSGVTPDVDAVVCRACSVHAMGGIEPLDRYLAANPEARIVFRKVTSLVISPEKC